MLNVKSVVLASLLVVSVGVSASPNYYGTPYNNYSYPYYDSYGNRNYNVYAYPYQDSYGNDNYNVYSYPHLHEIPKGDVGYINEDTGEESVDGDDPDAQEE